MSLITANIFSKELMRTVDITVILPSDKIAADVPEKFPTLYLLHGIFGSHIDWVSGTRIQRWAEERNIAVVMPSGDNSCYVNDVSGKANYSNFIGEELVELTRKMFPLEDDYNKTYIAGLSMGAFGALYNGVTYSKTYSHIGVFSIGLLNEIAITKSGSGMVDRLFFEDKFGISPEESFNTDFDPRYLLKNKKAEIGMQKFFIACGLQDPLYIYTEAIHETMVVNELEHEYRLQEGSHEWDYWDRIILEFLDWLSEEKSKGLNSGNAISGKNE